MASSEERKDNDINRNPVLYERYLRWVRRDETKRTEATPTEIADAAGLSRQHLWRIVAGTHAMIGAELGLDHAEIARRTPGKAAQIAKRAAVQRWKRRAAR